MEQTLECFCKALLAASSNPVTSNSANRRYHKTDVPSAAKIVDGQVWEGEARILMNALDHGYGSVRGRQRTAKANISASIQVGSGADGCNLSCGSSVVIRWDCVPASLKSEWHMVLRFG
jgi:hypothetical protein